MASKSSNIDVKIFIVAKIEGREKYGITYVFCENEVRLMTFPPKFFDVLKSNKFYLCRGVAIGETVRLYESSRVFQCGKFPLDQGKINNFLRPPTQSIEDILASPEKRNVSCRGILRKISDVIESPTSKRRELTLESLEGKSSVVCKLWGDQADLPVPAADTIVTAVCVQVANWKGNISLNSSVLTSLRETDEESSFEGEVEAVEILESFSYIIVNDKTLKIASDLLLTIFPNYEFLEGMRVSGKTRGATVAEIKVLNPKKKNKKENQM